MASQFHHKLHTSPVLFAILATVAILVGTLVTMFLPMLTPQMHPKLENLKPFTPVQLAGRDIYQREGCNNCHTQTVRPLKTEVMRYGEYSKAGEFAYDRPFLWGSKRTGPDLARIGGKYPDVWHYGHFENPQAFFAESNMPSSKSRRLPKWSSAIPSQSGPSSDRRWSTTLVTYFERPV